MSLAAGNKLGPYKILALIGKGGMGEVYRAHDPRTGSDDRIMVTDYAVKGDAFTFSTPRAWSDKQILRRNTRQNFDLSRDGKRVAAIPRPDAEVSAGTLHVTFLLNFFDDVRRRIPGGK